MKTPTYDEAALLPLTTDADITERVELLIGRANQRQLWLLFLDELNLQLPLLIPVEGLPVSPTEAETALILDRVREVMGELGASSIVVVIERYGPSAPTPQDLDWARSIRRACEATGVSLRAQLLSHRTGVSWISTEDPESRIVTRPGE